MSNAAVLVQVMKKMGVKIKGNPNEKKAKRLFEESLDAGKQVSKITPKETKALKALGYKIDIEDAKGNGTGKKSQKKTKGKKPTPKKGAPKKTKGTKTKGKKKDSTRIRRGEGKAWLQNFLDNSLPATRKTILKKFAAKFGEEKSPSAENYLAKAKTDSDLFGFYLVMRRDEDGKKLLYQSKKPSTKGSTKTTKSQKTTKGKTKTSTKKTKGKTTMKKAKPSKEDKAAEKKSLKSKLKKSIQKAKAGKKKAKASGEEE